VLRWAEHSKPLKLADRVRFPAESYTEDLKNGNCGMSSLVLGVDGGVQKECLTRGAFNDMPPMQQWHATNAAMHYKCRK